MFNFKSRALVGTSTVNRMLCITFYPCLIQHTVIVNEIINLSNLVYGYGVFYHVTVIATFVLVIFLGAFSNYFCVNEILKRRIEPFVWFYFFPYFSYSATFKTISHPLKPA